MSQTLGLGWSRHKLPALALSALLLASLLGTPETAASLEDATRSFVDVIVQAAPGRVDAAEDAVVESGGTVERRLSIIGGFVATVPADAVEGLFASPDVTAVTPDASVRMHHAVDGIDASANVGSMFNTAKAVGAREMWSDGYRGDGVDVALIDSGVLPVEGLVAPDKIVHGPDLSFESQSDNLRYLDSFGHGTHMAGIIAGRDMGGDGEADGNHHRFKGIAPRARLVNVKVANAMGATDVSQVIAAIDWVVQHRTDGDLNIRVLNLSFGTDGVQDYQLDPLSYAVENAWHKGVVVVVAGGNEGFGSAKLNNPAYNPYVIAVGASDPNGTAKTHDDTVPEWSSRGNGTRNPDVVAPGRSVVSLRAPNSHIDQANPQGQVGSRFFKGSGTSQSAAVVSGAAALLLQQRPNLTPDQVKALLTSTATPLPSADAQAQGSGLIDLGQAKDAPTPDAVQTWPRSTGTGTLEGARGSVHLEHDGVVLEGEQDIFGNPWDGQTWSGQTWSGQTWSGGRWNGQTWSGQTWSGQTWSGQTWSGQTWSGQTWSGQTWSGQTWSGQTWSGQTWSGQTWSGQTWS
jgi:serine protease AprX